MAERPTGERLRFGDESEPIPPATVTLVEGASFVICDAAGDIASGRVEGLFVADTRVCSQLALTIDDCPVEPLTVTRRSPSEAVFVARSDDRGLLVFRELHVGGGLRLDLRVRNLTAVPRVARAALTLRADLADLFAVKEGRAAGSSAPCTAADATLVFAASGARRGLVVRAAGAEATENGSLHWEVALDPHEEWETCIELAALRGGDEVPPRYRCGQEPGPDGPSSRQADWQRHMPRLESDLDTLEGAFERAADDLGGLRLFDPQHPDDAIIAAGAPWYMTLFGRDSIITSWMALVLDPAIGLATVRTLARLQGQRDDPRTEEQPGRILHEVRFAAGASLAFRDGDVYYGTADATPLFVMLVHELWRWGVPLEQLAPVLPAVDAALGWMAGPGDADGDGYIEYDPRHESSLVNQGWKDSFDGVSFADGTLPHAPIALAEVQAYAYAAWRAGSALAAAAGDHVRASARRARADVLQTQFERDFWMPERGALALALDRDKTAVDAIASNMGHCLWTGIVADPAKRASIARWLTSPELFSQWGIRTLATSMARYNPLSYHNGSVWPHDTAICVAGLRRAGFVDEAARVSAGLLAASTASDGRLPELFAGLTADEVPAPVPYPASCSPQAWAAAAPLLVLRSLLGLEPDLPGGSVAVDPVLPPGATVLRLADLPLGPHRVTIEVEGDAVAVRGLPRTLSLVRPAS